MPIEAKFSVSIVKSRTGIISGSPCGKEKILTFLIFKKERLIRFPVPVYLITFRKLFNCIYVRFFLFRWVACSESLELLLCSRIYLPYYVLIQWFTVSYKEIIHDESCRLHKYYFLLMELNCLLLLLSILLKHGIFQFWKLQNL